MVMYKPCKTFNIRMSQFKGYYNKTSSLELKNIDLGQPPVPCLDISPWPLYGGP